MVPLCGGLTERWSRLLPTALGFQCNRFPLDVPCVRRPGTVAPRGLEPLLQLQVSRSCVVAGTRNIPAMVTASLNRIRSFKIYRKGFAQLDLFNRRR
ncbi:hypothetical protein PoB_004219000 [Plakobranchus ocellatus]|uniref:Uncharacterized protein n=1 Tax=Plakobranchus ocellatus TaxID=259542 RepID=A0AAV4B530_9GAST|nr:hypothetical protein PoB_004219000 [Plakobranchus ocellatus]